MNIVNGIALPDREDHLPPFIATGPIFAGKGTYQLAKLNAAMRYVKKFDCAVDIGAHVGLWSRVLAHKFLNVVCFEPVPEHRACWAHNMEGLDAVLHPLALGNVAGAIRISQPHGNTGNSHVSQNGDIEADMIRLDDAPLLLPPDFVKIDCEGFEKFVVMGGENVFKSAKPVVVVEQKPRNGTRYGLQATEAADLLQSWGAVTKDIIHGDHILVWE